MGKRPILSFLLLSLMTVMSCSNVPGTSSIAGSSFLQLSESLNLTDDFNTLFSNKRVLPASDVLIRNEQCLAGSDINVSRTEDPKTEFKEEKPVAPKKDKTLVFGGAAHLLIRKI